jgi:ectoine hydroxylase-related dioxygenase (phytanoyl-CoA dioxygenase family)
MDEFMLKMLGEGYMVSSYTANIARPGSVPMFMHNDQMPINPAIREVTLGANIAWFLDDVTEENGGTRILVGTHKGRIAPDDLYDTTGTVAAEGPAGTALVFDSRLWHCTGPNMAAGGERKLLLTFMNRYFIRPQENAFLSMTPGA